MASDCVVIADGGRARFFTVDWPKDERFESGPRLREHEDWANPEGKMTGLDLFTDVKSGRRQSPGGGQAHLMDDHRDRHRREIDRRFAHSLARAIDEFVVKQRATRLILAADPRMLGTLREPLAKQLPSELKLEELCEDLSWHAVAHIEKVLTKRGLLPEKREPTASIYRPRAQPPPAHVRAPPGGRAARPNRTQGRRR
jgi:protein required for attachment to host cells